MIPKRAPTRLKSSARAAEPESPAGSRSAPRSPQKAASAPAGLAGELRKRRPFDLPEEEAVLNLTRTADRIAAGFERLFREYGLTPSTYNVLRILRGASETGGDAGNAGLPCQEIAERMVTRDPDITRLVDRLEKAGLAARGRIAQDRRVILVQITPAGRRLLAAIDAPLQSLHRAQLGHMTRAELAELNRLLLKARSVPARNVPTGGRDGGPGGAA